MDSRVVCHPGTIAISRRRPADARAQAEEIIAAIGDALAEAELTIEELAQAIVGRVGRWAGERVMPHFRICGHGGGSWSAGRVTAACSASAPTATDG